MRKRGSAGILIHKIIKVGSEYDTPILVTLALSEEVLIHKKFEDNTLIQTIIDNLLALDSVDGFYIVVSRNGNSVNVTERNIVQTILELSFILGKRFEKKVFLNFLDNLGFLGLAAGAYAFGSGYYNKEKRFNFKVLTGFIIYPFYCLTWVPITIEGFLTKGNKEWSHTVHTREISINELENCMKQPSD
jgi:hypothetical protein